jgi:hypothetical protein
MKRIAPQEDDDDDVCHYEFPDCGRLILDTIHGRIIIDVRKNDVNSFVFVNGVRIDKLLIQNITQANHSHH